MIHGAIAGWYGQVAVSVPGSGDRKTIRRCKNRRGNGTIRPLPQIAARLAEAIKVLTENPHSLISRILYIDLLQRNQYVYANIKPSRKARFLSTRHLPNMQLGKWQICSSAETAVPEIGQHGRTYAHIGQKGEDQITRALAYITQPGRPQMGTPVW